MPIYQIILVIAVVILVFKFIIKFIIQSYYVDSIAILVIYSFIRRYLYEKQLKEYNERIEKEMAEKKAAYQSGQAYRNGSDDVIDVNYVEKDENE